jgi:hypothetical protein
LTQVNSDIALKANSSDLTVITGAVNTTSYVTDGVFELRKIGNIVCFSSRTGITLAGLSLAGQ